MNKLNSQINLAFCVNNSDYPASLELHKIYVMHFYPMKKQL
jgi:hypothetical protein